MMLELDRSSRRSSADIAGLEREFGRKLTKLPEWVSRHARPNGQGEFA